jgi:hypothetical protein
LGGEGGSRGKEGEMTQILYAHMKKKKELNEMHMIPLI